MVYGQHLFCLMTSQFIDKWFPLLPLCNENISAASTLLFLKNDYQVSVPTWPYDARPLLTTDGQMWRVLLTPSFRSSRVVEENFSAVLRRVESEWIGSDWTPFLHSAGCQLIQSPHSLRYVHADNTSEQRLWLLSVVMRQQLCLYWYIPKQDRKK